MLKYKIKEMLEASGIQYPAKWLALYCDISVEKAYKILNNRIRSLQTKDFANICKALNCHPSELMYWEDTAYSTLPETHPCKTAMTAPAKTTQWFKLFKQLPMEKVAEVQQKIQDEIGDKIIE